MLFPVTYWFGNNTLLFAGQDRAVICSREPFILDDVTAPVPDGYVKWRQVQPESPLISILSPEDGISDGTTFVRPLILVPVGFDSAQTIVLELTNLITGETSRVSIDHNIIENITTFNKDAVLFSSSGRAFYGEGEQITSISFVSLQPPNPGSISFGDTLVGNRITWDGVYSVTKPKQWLVYLTTSTNPNYQLTESIDFDPTKNYATSPPSILDNLSYHSIRIDILDEVGSIITGDNLFIRRAGSNKGAYGDEPLVPINYTYLQPSSEASYIAYRVYLANINYEVTEILQISSQAQQLKSTDLTYNDYRFYLLNISLASEDIISTSARIKTQASIEATYSSYFFSLGGIQI